MSSQECPDFPSIHQIPAASQCVPTCFLRQSTFIMAKNLSIVHRNCQTFLPSLPRLLFTAKARSIVHDGMALADSRSGPTVLAS